MKPCEVGVRATMLMRHRRRCARAALRNCLGLTFATQKKKKDKNDKKDKGDKKEKKKKEKNGKKDVSWAGAGRCANRHAKPRACQGSKGSDDEQVRRAQHTPALCAHLRRNHAETGQEEEPAARACVAVYA